MAKTSAFRRLGMEGVGCGMALLMLQLPAAAQNQQIVHASGGIINSAAVAAKATTNIATVQGMPVPPGNRQIANVNGVIVNSAVYGANAELNIAFKTPRGPSGSQVISVGGAVINQAYGGQSSVMNIGSSR